MSLTDPALLAVIAAVSFGAAMVATKIGLRDMSAPNPQRDDSHCGPPWACSNRRHP